MYHNGIINIDKISLSKYINQDRHNYYKAISESEKPVKVDSNIFMDITPFIYYLLSTLKEALADAFSLQGKLSKKEIELLLKIQKKGEGTEITVKECSEILELPEIRCRTILNNLTSQGYFSKRYEKKKNIYTLLIS